MSKTEELVKELCRGANLTCSKYKKEMSTDDFVESQLYFISSVCASLVDWSAKSIGVKAENERELQHLLMEGLLKDIERVTLEMIDESNESTERETEK